MNQTMNQSMNQTMSNKRKHCLIDFYNSKNMKIFILVPDQFRVVLYRYRLLSYFGSMDQYHSWG